MIWLWVALGIAIGVAGAYVFRLFSWKYHERALRAEFQLWHEGRIVEERANALTSSRRVLVGKYVEQFVPFHVPYEPADMKFLGSPVDYIIFKGLHDDVCTEIIFLEVKTNSATITKREQSIRDAIRKGNVRWEEVKLQTHEN